MGQRERHAERADRWRGAQPAETRWSDLENVLGVNRQKGDRAARMTANRSSVSVARMILVFQTYRTPADRELRSIGSFDRGEEWAWTGRSDANCASCRPALRK